MKESIDEYKARILATADKRGEFVIDVDGYVYYWPINNGGHLTSHLLRWIADELDRRNKKIDDEIRAFFESLNESDNMSDVPATGRSHSS